jgi:lipoprotein-anchoring transpeptidase ErfK/SrfK
METMPGLDVARRRGLSAPRDPALKEPPVTRLFTSLSALLLLAACATAPVEDAPPVEVPGYEGVQDGAFFIQPVEARYLDDMTVRQEVDYAGSESAGTIVVDPFARRLYLVMENGRAMRYSVAVGRQGLAFRGNGTIRRKEEWPAWTPTANMIRTFPETYAEYRGGLPGGLENPLGARAMYLYRGGRDTFFRIHGTVQNASIGHATSAGCIRLFNQDAIDLYNRVDLGTQVKVRSLADSIAMEGPFMDDAYGRAVPETPENIAKKEADLITIAEEEAAAAAIATEPEPPAEATETEPAAEAEPEAESEAAAG